MSVIVTQHGEYISALPKAQPLSPLPSINCIAMFTSLLRSVSARSLTFRSRTALHRSFQNDTSLNCSGTGSDGLFLTTPSRRHADTLCSKRPAIRALPQPSILKTPDCRPSSIFPSTTSWRTLYVESNSRVANFIRAGVSESGRKVSRFSNWSFCTKSEISWAS